MSSGGARLSMSELKSSRAAFLLIQHLNSLAYAPVSEWGFPRRKTLLNFSANGDVGMEVTRPFRGLGIVRRNKQDGRPRILRAPYLIYAARRVGLGRRGLVRGIFAELGVAWVGVGPPWDRRLVNWPPLRSLGAAKAYKLRSIS